MKILFLDQFSTMGGGQRCLLDVIEEVESRGWSGTVALPGDGPFADAVRASGFAVAPIRCGPYRAERKTIGDLAQFGADVIWQYRELKLIVGRGNFDLIYVNGPRLLPAAAAIRGQIPLLFHGHSRPAQRAALHSAGLILRQSLATVVCCSQYVADGYRVWIPGHNLQVIPNGVPDTRALKVSRSDRRNALRIGVVGRIEPAKGQMLLIDAMHRVHDVLPACEIRLFGSPGAGASQYVEALRRSADRLNIRFMGESENISDVLAGLDLLVVPSANEGMPRIVLEAFSAELPVLAFPVGGLAEIVVDGETGFLTHGRSVDALASGLLRAVRASRSDLLTMTANARRVWAQQYTSELFRSRIAALVQKIALRQDAEAEIPKQRRHTA